MSASTDRISLWLDTKLSQAFASFLPASVINWESALNANSNPGQSVSDGQTLFRKYEGCSLRWSSDAPESSDSGLA